MIARAQLEKLIEDLGQIPPDVRQGLRKGIREGTRPMIGQMKANAAWSTRIPSAITVRTSFGARPGVTVLVNARKAPHARPYEGLSGDPFKHPQWGRTDRPWSFQAARPFFFRAVRQHGDRVTEAVGEVIAEAERKHGFH